MARSLATVVGTLAMALLCVPSLFGQVAVQGKKIHTMAGTTIEDGTVVIENGKITAIGRTGQIAVPAGFRTLAAEVVTPGLIDAHSTVGFSGIVNSPHDQDQLERSSPIQPELRAIDGYNAQEDLIEWIRGFGVTTVHAGHAPGELVSGQTLVAKTFGNTAAAAVIVEARAVAATLGPAAQKTGGKSPGTRGKSMAMLRAELIKAREYRDKLARAAADKEKAEKGEMPPRDLRLESLVRVLAGELPLLVTANQAQDIVSALRLAKEFEFKLWLDGACEAFLVVDDIKAAGVPVFVHPTMTRAYGEHENLSFTTAQKLVAAGIPVALQSGYESYVPKTRVVLFEAAVAAAHGLSFDQALATITIDAAKILGIDKRVGSLEVGKDGDLALYDGDPFEYTSHCIGCVIEGRVVSEAAR
ncbi:MAG TPA: amidohydrolase family protein [Pirellulales bacterium]|jgi:imidazolonepropionase-like amidohydrolase|nr:amidohydrolase family protein [Pirellulales bacterium]